MLSLSVHPGWSWSCPITLGEERREDEFLLHHKPARIVDERASTVATRWWQGGSDAPRNWKGAHSMPTREGAIHDQERARVRCPQVFDPGPEQGTHELSTDPARFPIRLVVGRAHRNGDGRRLSTYEFSTRARRAGRVPSGPWTDRWPAAPRSCARRRARWSGLVRRSAARSPRTTCW